MDNQIDPQILQAFASFAEQNPNNQNAQGMLFSLLGNFLQPQAQGENEFEQQARASVLNRILDEDVIDKDLVGRVLSNEPIQDIFNPKAQAQKGKKGAGNEISDLVSEQQRQIEEATLAGQSEKARMLSALDPASFAEYQNFQPQSKEDQKEGKRKTVKKYGKAGSVQRLQRIFSPNTYLEAPGDLSSLLSGTKSSDKQLLDELDRLSQASMSQQPTM